MLVRSLHWDELKGATFDREEARRVVGELVEGRGDRQELVEKIERRLMSTFGSWASGWQWAAGEGGGGGPVNAWCCADHSMFREGEGAGATVDRVVEALEDWCAVLRELRARYDAILEECLEMPVDRHVERAAARLLPYVLERTNGFDAWYETMAAILEWYLESAGLDPCRSEGNG